MVWRATPFSPIETSPFKPIWTYSSSLRSKERRATPEKLQIQVKAPTPRPPPPPIWKNKKTNKTLSLLCRFNVLRDTQPLRVRPQRGEPAAQQTDGTTGRKRDNNKRGQRRKGLTPVQPPRLELESIAVTHGAEKNHRQRHQSQLHSPGRPSSAAQGRTPATGHSRCVWVCEVLLLSWTGEHTSPPPLLRLLPPGSSRAHCAGRRFSPSPSLPSLALSSSSSSSSPPSVSRPLKRRVMAVVGSSPSQPEAQRGITVVGPLAEEGSSRRRAGA